MAGVWDTNINKDTGEEIKCFSILTTQPNELMHKIKHHRCPVILEKEQQKQWLEDRPMDQILKLSTYQYPANKMNAYPVAKLVGNSSACVEPIGERIF